MRFESVRGSSPSGGWCFTSARSAELAPFVDHLWAYAGPTQHAEKRIFPNGCIELLVNLEAPYHEIDRERGTRAALPVAWVSGLASGALVVEQPVRQHCIAARLRPRGAFMLLARPLREVTGLSVELGDLVGADARELVDRCASAESDEDRLRVLARWLHARIARGRAPDRAIAWAAAELDRSSGAAPIDALAARAGRSRTRMRDAFRDQIGVAPKLYARIVRFRRALALLQESDAPRLGEIALRAGFCDQPHMNAELRALGGLTPRQFLAARHPVGDGSTAAEPFLQDGRRARA